MKTFFKKNHTPSRFLFGAEWNGDALHSSEGQKEVKTKLKNRAEKGVENKEIDQMYEELLEARKRIWARTNFDNDPTKQDANNKVWNEISQELHNAVMGMTGTEYSRWNDADKTHFSFGEFKSFLEQAEKEVQDAVAKKKLKGGFEAEKENVGMAINKMSSQQKKELLKTAMQQETAAMEMRTELSDSVSDVLELVMKEMSDPKTREGRISNWYGFDAGFGQERQQYLKKLETYHKKNYGEFQQDLLAGKDLKTLLALDKNKILRDVIEQSGIQMDVPKTKEEALFLRAEVLKRMNEYRRYDDVRENAPQMLGETFKKQYEKWERDPKIMKEADDEAAKVIQKYGKEWKEKGMTEDQMNVLQKEMRTAETSKVIGKKTAEEFDTSTLSAGEKAVWEQYKSSSTEEFWNSVTEEIAINAPLIAVSGGIASIARAGVSVPARMVLGNFAKNLGVRVAGLVAGTLVEGATFEGTNTALSKILGIKNTQWPADFPEWGERILWSSVTLGAFHGAGKFSEKLIAGATKESTVLSSSVVSKITNEPVKKMINTLVASGIKLNVEAATMLAISAVQKGYYKGNLDEFFKNIGNEVLHSYVMAGSLKMGGKFVEPLTKVMGEVGQELNQIKLKSESWRKGGREPLSENEEGIVHQKIRELEKQGKESEASKYKSALQINEQLKEAKLLDGIKDRVEKWNTGNDRTPLTPKEREWVRKKLKELQTNAEANEQEIKKFENILRGDEIFFAEKRDARNNESLKNITPEEKTSLGIIETMKETDQVKKIQEVCKNLGLYRGEIDGDFGTGTRKALEKWRDRREVAANESINDASRISKTEEILKRNMTQMQKTALLEAHQNPDINKKARILKEAGFSATERRTLMEKRLAGWDVQNDDILTNPRIKIPEELIKNIDPHDTTLEKEREKNEKREEIPGMENFTKEERDFCNQELKKAGDNEKDISKKKKWIETLGKSKEVIEKTRQVFLEEISKEILTQEDIKNIENELNVLSEKLNLELVGGKEARFKIEFFLKEPRIQGFIEQNNKRMFSLEKGGAEVTGIFKPSEARVGKGGGDFYNIKENSENLEICIADAMGHGQNAQVLQEFMNVLIPKCDLSDSEMAFHLDKIGSALSLGQTNICQAKFNKKTGELNLSVYGDTGIIIYRPSEGKYRTTLERNTFYEDYKIENPEKSQEYRQNLKDYTEKSIIPLTHTDGTEVGQAVLGGWGAFEQCYKKGQGRTGITTVQLQPGDQVILTTDGYKESGSKYNLIEKNFDFSQSEYVNQKDGYATFCKNEAEKMAQELQQRDDLTLLSFTYNLKK